LNLYSESYVMIFLVLYHSFCPLVGLIKLENDLPKSEKFGCMQYREAGVLLWRGFTLQEFANQLFSNKYDNGKGRQMPAHYGSNKHNYFTIASTIAWVLKALMFISLCMPLASWVRKLQNEKLTSVYSTQISHAVGAAYSLKMDKKDACAVTYFGDGGSSEVNLP